jgi:hypothetical protein
LVDVKKLAEDADAEAEFPALPFVRPHKKKLNSYFSVLDTTVTSINEMSGQLQTHNADFSFLYDIRCPSRRELQGTLTDSGRGERDICPLRRFWNVSSPDI